eukprot:5042453-Pyramimonas_sp.AAC.1
MSAHPSRVSWPHGELHRRPQMPRCPFRCTPRAFRGPIRSSTERPRRSVRMWGSRQFRHILRRFVAP